MHNAVIKSTAARLATMKQLMAGILRAHFGDGMPCERTFKRAFDRERIPRMKANPTCKHGGGKVYYSVPHVEQWLVRLLPGRMSVR